jgi:Zn-finger in Ran binding protein and others
MLIPPPSCKEEVVVERKSYTEVMEYLNVEPWKCPVCNLINFGRNERCAACKRDRS